ncbi:DUF4349 domain-containing protein [Aeoliella sp. ICT_H6.2]|uniref:DUF4349 domain-containing protein n=1 Tax=Aeoliella straminimaris TaxID=2954799 RepID=A0A9X2F544_9BACT|nr:DUF4349 domain-containing protein [Aeoliella straminimaris]MCO6042380.1 DUF4349 domain-containing protein [Aeoliella straminimaris]
MFRLTLALACLAATLGCGQSASHRISSDAPKVPRSEVANKLKELGVAFESYRENGEAISSPSEAADNRKIIYTASLSIVVDDFTGVEQSITSLVKQYGGFIANANLALNQGSERSGTWTVRVPVASFESFLDASGDLGVPERREQNGQDVTEEYVDLEARIRSKKKLEERILELLAANKGEIKDVIEVERELSRVRTDIEQMEGRLRYLADRTELTTITLYVREQQDYQPPQAPGFGTQIATTWTGSTGAIFSLAKNAMLAVVACVPWLLIAGLVVGPWWAWRRK